MACLKPHPSPLADPNLAKKQQRQQQHQFKRKRTNSFEPAPVKRQKPDLTVQTAPAKLTQAPTLPCPSPTQGKATAAPSVALEIKATAPPAKATLSADQIPHAQNTVTPAQGKDVPQVPAPVPKVEPAMSHEAESAVRTRAHERIEANLNLQILLKHDELRLIEQELGKCQIALEQLRRCKTIPFPGQPGSQISADCITSGTGPSVQPAAGLSRPSHLAPFGVTDGPYSRHYAQWLIPDPTFDPSPPRPPRLSTTSQSIHGRSIRASYDSLTSATTPRAGRGTISSHNAILPSNFSVPRDRHAPLTVPRPSDGKLVKMVCKVCGKKDSANVQGFTNHCRIAHGINYASHSEAIVDCGQLVGNDEAQGYVPPTPPEPKPANNISAAPQSTGRPLVHPLITASMENQSSNRPLFGKAAPPPMRKSDNASSPTRSLSDSKGRFVASPGNPHLSALLKKRGFDTDLKHLVTVSKQKIDLNEVSPLVSDDDEDMDPTTSQNSAASTPQRLIGKPKNRRANMALSGVRIPGRSQAGPSKLQINTSPARFPAVGAGSAHSSQSNSASTPFAFAPQRMLCPDSFSSKASSAASFSALNHSFGLDGSRSSTVASPLEVDRPELPGTPEESSETPSSSAHLSPHTIETNPGLITDNEDDADYVDSEQEDRESVDAAMNRSGLVDVNVKVREDDGHHTDEIMQHLEHAAEEKSKGPPSPIPTGVLPRRSSVASGGTITPRKRGRPRKNP